jgi:hypothetical protein
MITRLLSRLAERRRLRHEDPYSRTEMDAMRCRLQKLIQAARS